MSSEGLSSPAASQTGETLKRKRSRCNNACQRCKVKKLRCNRADEDSACHACFKAQTTCVMDIERSTSLPSRERFVLEDKIRSLESRLSRYEGSSSLRLPRSQLEATWLVNGADPNFLVSTSLPTSTPSDKVFDLVHIHMRSRYPFLDWDILRDWYKDRESICIAGGTRRVEAYFVWMLCAVGTQLDPQGTPIPAKSYFGAAWNHIQPVLQQGGLVAAEALLLAAFYSFRSQEEVSYWTLGGHAMRCCIEMSLHRASGSSDYGPYEMERRKRVFWTAYSFDRLMSLAQDKPFSISDGDIDLDLPNDNSDKDVYDVGFITSPLPKRIASMSSCIHSVKLYRIMSRVHTTFYSVHAPVPTAEASVAFLAELAQWRQDIPPITPQGIGIPTEAFEIRYLRCVLYTLRPSILDADPSDSRVVLCASAAAEACELGRTVHQQSLTQRSMITPRHAFISGITLLHCLSLDPTVVPRRVSLRAVRACSTTLAVLAQHFPQGQKLSELFEHLADEILCGEGPAGARESLKSLLCDNRLRPSRSTIDPQDSIPAPMPDIFAGPSGLTPFLELEMPPVTPLPGVDESVPSIEGWADWSDFSWIT